jgi:hypothetical protein
LYSLFVKGFQKRSTVTYIDGITEELIKEMFNVIRKNGLVDNLKSWEVFEEKKVGIKRLTSISMRFPQNIEQTKKSSKNFEMYTAKIIFSQKN